MAFSHLHFSIRPWSTSVLSSTFLSFPLYILSLGECVHSYEFSYFFGVSESPICVSSLEDSWNQMTDQYF